MTQAEAAKLLQIPEDATPDQVEARYNELRHKLEEKIVKAPTPGLKAKYRESLDAVTAAFETLALAADSSALPVLKKEAGDRSPEAGGPASLRAAGAEIGGGRPEAGAAASSARKKSGGMEFVIVAVIAIAVLGAGGWWVMKSRAEQAEQARIAAIEKAEAEAKAAAEKAAAERRAAEERRLAEEKRRAEEEEKARIAAAEKAEQERVERLLVSVRLQLAEARLGWEALEREEREAVQQLADLKADQRSMRGGAATQVEELNARIEVAQAFVDWLQDHLVRHPARLLRIRTEELLSSRMADEATAELVNLRAALETARPEIAERRRRLEATLHGPVRLALANRVDRWRLVDAFGQEFNGPGQEKVELPKVARGKATVTLWRGGAAQDFAVTVQPERPTEAALRYPESSIAVTANVPGAEVFGPEGSLGRVPLTLADQWPGAREFEVRAAGYVPVKIAGTVVAGKNLALTANLVEDLPTEAEIITDFTTRAAGVWAYKGGGLASGYVKVVPGSTRVESIGKALLMTVRAAGTISVTDRRQRTIRYLHENSAQGTGEMNLRLEGEELIFSMGGKDYPYVRTDKSPW